MKVLFVDTIFISPTGEETANFIWSSEPCRGQAICRAKAVPSFLSHFKMTSVGSVPGTEPLTSCSAVKCSTDWAYPAVVNYFKPLSSKLSSDPSTCVSSICQECDRQWKNACSNESSQKLCHIHYKTLSQFTWLHPGAVTFDLVFFVCLHQLKSWEAKVPWGYCWILSMGK